MLYNVWERIKKAPNNHERAARDEADKVKRETPQPIPGRPGWFTLDGKLTYDPMSDPAFHGDIKRLADAEAAKKALKVNGYFEPGDGGASAYFIDDSRGSEDLSLYRKQMANDGVAAFEFFAQSLRASLPPRFQDILLYARSRVEFEELVEKHRPVGVFVERYFHGNKFQCEDRSDRPGVLLVTMPLAWNLASDASSTAPSKHKPSPFRLADGEGTDYYD